MTSFLLLSIFIAASLSLVSYLYCWWDIKGGKPHIISLRQITNIMDRHILDLLFGDHDKNYYYTLSPEKLKIFERAWGRYFHREVAADFLCMLGAYRYMTGISSHGTLALFVLLATACQAINFTHSIILVRRWRHQIREELEEWGE